MVRMPVFWGIGDHDVRSVDAEQSGDAFLMRSIVLEEPIGHLQVEADGTSQDACGLLCFEVSDLRRSARPHFPAGQVDDARLFSLCSLFGQKTASSEFYVIGMRSKSEYIQFHWTNIERSVGGFLFKESFSPSRSQRSPRSADSHPNRVPPPNAHWRRSGTFGNSI